MRKILLMLFCSLVAFVTSAETTVDLAFTNKLWSGTWSQSYSDHSLTADSYTVKITKASKQSATVSDVPVVKASDITLTMTGGTTLANTTVNFKQWSSKTQTATIAYSTNGTDFTKVSSDAVTLNASTLSISTGDLPENVIAVRVSTTNTSNQIGVVSIVFEENNAGPIDYTPGWENVSIMEGETQQLVLGGSHPEIAFASSNTAVAGVDAEGLITATGVGTATITATWSASDKFNAGSVSFDVEVTEYVKTNYIKTDIANIITGDKVVIVDLNTGKALSPNGTASAPSAVGVEITSDKTALVNSPEDAIVFEVTVEDGKYKFGQGTNYLYTTASNNGVRLGTNSNNEFTWTDGFLKNTVTSRYIGVYNSSDWRCYTSTTTNITDTKTTFYVLSIGDKLASPVFTPEAGAVLAGTEVTISAAEGEVHYTTDGTEPTAASALYSAPIVVDKTMTIKAIAISGDKMSDVATADYTLIVPSTLAEATAMAGDSKYLMGDNLTVTYANGDYLYVTSNGAYGLVYTKGGNFNESFTAGDVVKGGWSGKVVVFNNLVELVPDAVADLVKNGTAEVPAPKTLASVTELTKEVVNMPVVIKNVTITAATPEDATAFTGTIKGDTGTIGLYNRFALPSAEPGVYDIEGLGSIFKENLQVYVTSMTPVASGPVDYNPEFENLSLTVGDTKQLDLGEKYPGEMIFISDNEDVVTVTDQGLITAVNVGKTSITVAWDADENFTANEDGVTFEVEVKEAAKVDWVHPFKDIELNEGDTYTFDLGEEYPTLILYESSNTSVATIDDNGVISAVAPGTANITAMWGDKKFNEGEVEFAVTVNEKSQNTEQLLYTIVFDDNNSDASQDVTSATLIEYAGETGKYIADATGISKVYKGIYGIKLGGSKGGGSVKLNLSDAGIKNTTKLVVNGKCWVSTKDAADKDAGLSVNGSDSQLFTKEAADYTYMLDGSRLDSIKIESTMRVYVKSISVYGVLPTCPYEVEVLTPGYAETVMLGENGEPAVIELESAALEGVTIYHKHVEAEEPAIPDTPDTPESVIARAVDHTGFSMAETNDKNNHVITINKPGTVTYYGYHTDSDTKGVERTVKVIPYDNTLGIEGIGDDVDGEATFYNLQGVRVENPAAGNVYIMVRGNKATKVLVK